MTYANDFKNTLCERNPAGASRQVIPAAGLAGAHRKRSQKKREVRVLKKRLASVYHLELPKSRPGPGLVEEEVHHAVQPKKGKQNGEAVAAK